MEIVVIRRMVENIISNAKMRFLVGVFGCATGVPAVAQFTLAKMEYNNPDLLVDLDVGFKSVPMPLDFDGDGDLDLLVSQSGSYVESGIYYFENISGNVDDPIFRQGDRMSSDRFRLGRDGKYFAVSDVEGSVHVLTPDLANAELLIYRDVPENVFWKRERMPQALGEYVRESGSNTWKMVDFDSDHRVDLVCSRELENGYVLQWLRNIGSNDDPDYTEPVTLIDASKCNGARETYPEVALGDYDNDGDLDYIAVTSFGQLKYFRNSGHTSSDCYFDAPIVLEGAQDTLQLYTFYGGATKLRAIDFNRDGYMDIIAGDEEGKVSFFKNTGEIRQGIPVFEQPRFFQQKARFLDVGALAAPRIFDWNGDGMDDIITGNGAGDILFVENLGGETPTWGRPELLQAGGEDLRIVADWAIPGTEDPHWGYTTLDVGDFNGDDLPDLLVNEHNGNIVFIENVGTRKRPVLATPRPLEVKWKGAPQKPAWIPGVSNGNELLAPWRTSPLMMDYNEDGVNDLVMLDYEGYLATFINSKVDGKWILEHPVRNFIYPDGTPVLLNQLKGSSHGRLKITWADWDGDGLKDLIFSSKPAVDWMKNRGKIDGNTVLQYMGRVVSRTLMGHTDGPVVSDFDKDGVLDLVVGTETGVLYYWRRPHSEITTTMTTTGKQKPATYKYFKR